MEGPMTPIVLFRTVVGSHMWGQNHPGSDTDVFECYVAPTRDILRGTAYTRSEFDQSVEGRDVARHEIGHVIDQLLKGNVNFVWGVTSPVVESALPITYPLVEGYTWLRALRLVLTANPSRNIYHSIHGLAQKNMAKYIDDPRVAADLGPERIQKKLRTIVRTCEFGSRWLNGEGADYRPGLTQAKYEPNDVIHAANVLQFNYEGSKLLDAPDPTPFRDLLERIRMDELDGGSTRLIYPPSHSRGDVDPRRRARSHEAPARP
jgi:hypothetical protein